MLCALATLVAVPVLLTSAAGSEGEVVAIAVPETISASELETDVDIDDLFDAGANLDDVPVVPIEERGAAVAGEVVAAAPQSILSDASTGSRSGFETTETPASSPEATDSTTVSEDPVTAAAPSTTEAPRVASTDAPTTTEAPAAEAPTTEAPPVTEAPEAEPIVEAPQSIEQPSEEASSAPTPEQWAALRQCEASGNYSIVSGNGLYHGAYQFYQPTWDALADQAGRPDLIDVAPSQAAPGDQDALALLLWQQRGNQPWPHCGAHLPAGS